MSFKRRFEIRVLDLEENNQKSLSLPNIKQLKMESATSILKKIEDLFEL